MRVGKVDLLRFTAKYSRFAVTSAGKLHHYSTLIHCRQREPSKRLTTLLRFARSLGSRGRYSTLYSVSTLERRARGWECSHMCSARMTLCRANAMLHDNTLRCK